MSRNNDALWERGMTFYAGRTIDLNDLKGTELEGAERTFEDQTKVSGTAIWNQRIPGRKVTMRVVRNMTGVTLLAKEVVFIDPTSPNRVLGRVNTTAKAYPCIVDENIPSGGVPAGDLFYVAVRGPQLAKTTVGNGVSDITIGSQVIGSTGSAATTAAAATTNECGRVALALFTAPTTVASAKTFSDEMRLGYLGTALTARTTGNTNTDILIDVNVQWTPVIA